MCFEIGRRWLTIFQKHLPKFFTDLVEFIGSKLVMACIIFIMELKKFGRMEVFLNSFRSLRKTNHALDII